MIRLFSPCAAAQTGAACHLRRIIFGITLSWWFGPWALAQATPGADLVELTQRWVDKAVLNLAANAPHPLRMEASVGQPDSRLQLARCNRAEPYLPPGTRLWGKTRLGVRCVDGPVKWNVFLPISIKGWGPAWVVKGQVASGAVIGAEDVMETEVDWAEEASPVLTSPARWLGQVATRNLNAGQTLREAMVKPAQAFQAGSQVRVIAQGPGFRVASDGQALTVGVVGQLARVQMDNGRVATGRVIDNRTVRVDI